MLNFVAGLVMLLSNSVVFTKSKSHLSLYRLSRIMPLHSGTLLQLISTRSLYLECRACGHSNTVAVADLLQRLRPSACVKDITDRIKCRQCHKRSPDEVRLVEPNSSEALAPEHI